MPGDPILELKNVSAGYGRIKALKGISLKVFPGEIVAMIGANGAGKIDHPHGCLRYRSRGNRNDKL